MRPIEPQLENVDDELISKPQRESTEIKVESQSGGGRTTRHHQSLEDKQHLPAFDGTFPAMQFHEAANLFPMMNDRELSELTQDIKGNGLREDIWTYQGKIIDGRNRYRACQQAGVQPTFREWDGNGSLVAFIASLNLHRRHLTESQRAIVGAKIMPQFKQEAKERQGERTDLSANLQKGQPVHSAKQAAKVVNVSTRSVETARKIVRTGSPQLIEAVEVGKLSLNAAAHIASLPEQDQTEVVALPKKEILQKVREIRAGSKEAAGVRTQTPGNNPQQEEITDPGLSLEQIEEAINRMDKSRLVALMKEVTMQLSRTGMDTADIIETIKGLGTDGSNREGS